MKGNNTMTDRSRSEYRQPTERENTLEVEKEVKTSSAIIREKYLTNTAKAPKSAQIMNELAALSISPDGRKEIQRIIENQQASTDKAKMDIDAYFRDTFVSIMEEKGVLDFSSNEPLPFGRHAPVRDVRKTYGKKAATALIVADGKAIDKKSEHVVYREEIPEIFKSYSTTAIYVKDRLFNASVYSDKLGHFDFQIDPTKDGGIKISSAERKKEPQALFLAEVSGELWKHVLLKVKSGEDDAKRKIQIDSSQLSKYPRKLSYVLINNSETRDRISVLLKGKVQKTGIIEIAKNSEGIWVLDNNSAAKSSFKQEDVQNLAWGILGTPNGYVAPFLSREYKHEFGATEHTRIGLKIDYDSFFGKIEIDEMTFHFDEK